MNSMLGGAPLSWWIGFHALVVVLLVADLLLLSRGKHTISPKTAGLWTIMLIVLAGLFAAWLWYERGTRTALEFTSGYLIELSLSVDNLFVFLMLFRSVGVSGYDQHRALLWGIIGAIVMRAVFIVAGVSLLARFSWLTYVFGAFLLFAAWRLLVQKHGRQKRPGWVEKLSRRAHKSENGLDWRSFLLVILAVEVTDLIFALDSIPAVLAITRDEFVVYTSNIFAILGLRSLFFVLSGILERFRLLHYGLAAILAFVGLKMIGAEWVHVPVLVSLGVIVGILAVSIGLSLKLPPPASAEG